MPFVSETMEDVDKRSAGSAYNCAVLTLAFAFLTFLSLHFSEELMVHADNTPTTISGIYLGDINSAVTITGQGVCVSASQCHFSAMLPPDIDINRPVMNTNSSITDENGVSRANRPLAPPPKTV